MITFECSITCDKCDTEHIVGSLSQSAVKARHSAINAARARGWSIGLRGQWCITCTRNHYNEVSSKTE